MDTEYQFTNIYLSFIIHTHVPIPLSPLPSLPKITLQAPALTPGTFKMGSTGFLLSLFQLRLTYILNGAIQAAMEWMKK